MGIWDYENMRICLNPPYPSTKEITKCLKLKGFETKYSVFSQYMSRNYQKDLNIAEIEEILNKIFSFFPYICPGKNEKNVQNVKK